MGVVSGETAFSFALGMQEFLTFLLADFRREALFDVLIVHLHFVKVFMPFLLFLVDLLNRHLGLHFVVVNILNLLGGRLGILFLEIRVNLLHMLLALLLFFQ